MKLRQARVDDASAMARVLVDTTRLAFRDFIPPESLMSFTHEESERNWARSLAEIDASAESNSCIFVAEDDAGQIVGLSMGGPERSGHPRFTGEVWILVVAPTHQRQQVGRGLVGAVARRLSHRGLHSILVRVVEPNTAARHFYEALGGQIVPDVREEIEEDGTVLIQIAYGWPDAHVLF